MATETHKATREKRVGKDAMRTSEEVKELFDAIVQAEAEMPSVSKTANNPHYKSKYAPLDAVAKAAQPILAKHGLAIMVGSGECGESEVNVQTRIIHKSGQWIESDLTMTPRNRDGQGVGNCVTYGSRYGYRMVGLVTDEDNDGNPPATKPTPPAKAKARNWRNICESNPNTKEDVKGTKLTVKQLNKIWGDCKSDDPDAEFVAMIAVKLKEQQDVEAEM